MTNQIGISDSKFNNIWFGGTGTSTDQSNTITVARVSQAPVLTVLLQEPASAQVSQAPVLVVIDAPVGARATQQVVEGLETKTSTLRVTQQVLEVLYPVPIPAYVTQQVIEVLYPPIPEGGEFSFTWIGTEGGIWID